MGIDLVIESCVGSKSRCEEAQRGPRKDIRDTENKAWANTSGRGSAGLHSRRVWLKSCVEVCATGNGPEKVAWDQACGGSIGSVALLNVFAYESGIIRSWLVVTGGWVKMGRYQVLGLQSHILTVGRKGTQVYEEVWRKKPRDLGNWTTMPCSHQ